MPGVERERDYDNLPTATVVDDQALIEQELIDAAIENANFGLREARTIQHNRPTGAVDQSKWKGDCH